MDFLTLRGVLAECRTLRGEQLAAATALDDPAGLALHFAPSGVRLELYPQANPGLFLVAPPAGAPPLPPRRAGAETPFAAGPFAALLRGLNERFAGGRLAAVESAGMSRVALFTFERRDRFGDPVTATLVVELIGAFGNLILIDGPAATGRILERLQADRGRKDPRPLQRGQAWLAPGARGVDLLLDGAAALRAALAAPPAPIDAPGWLARLREAAAGVGPHLARELLAAAGAPPGQAPAEQAPPEQAPDEMAARLVAALTARVAEADAAADASAPFAASERARSAWQAGPQPRGAAGADAAAGVSLERHTLTQAVETRVTDATRRLERLREELARRPDGDAARRRAEALLAYAHEVPRGAAEVRLPLGEAEESAVIALDPRRSAADNAANYFREARKAERAAIDLPAKVRAAEAQLERLTGFRRRLAALPLTDAAGLAALAAEWRGDAPAPRGGAARGAAPGGAGSAAGRPPGKAAPAAPLGGAAARGPRAPSAALQPRRYEMPGGWVILVGRTEVGNDYLTHELAAPHDLWFHAHGAAGSHVVLKGPDKKAQPDKSLILTAAALAALNSKARHAAKVPVIYAEKRHVRKPRGGKPGLAAVTHEKSIMVRPGEPATREEA